MPVEQLKKIADEADMIVAGYAFTKNAEGLIQVLNLSNPEAACVLQKDGTMVETTMDTITVLKVQAYYLKNREFMEEEDA